MILLNTDTEREKCKKRPVELDIPKMSAYTRMANNPLWFTFENIPQERWDKIFGKKKPRP